MMGPYIIRKRWFTPPFGTFQAITLYPFIIGRLPLYEEDLRHELIHIHQIRTIGFWRFYLGYLWHTIKRTPYREIPVEKEAYDYEYAKKYLPPDLEELVKDFK